MLANKRCVISAEGLLDRADNGAGSGDDADDFGPAEARRKKPAPARAGKRGDMDGEIPF